MVRVVGSQLVKVHPAVGPGVPVFVDGRFQHLLDAEDFGHDVRHRLGHLVNVLICTLSYDATPMGFCTDSKAYCTSVSSLLLHMSSPMVELSSDSRFVCRPVPFRKPFRLLTYDRPKIVIILGKSGIPRQCILLHRRYIIVSSSFARNHNTVCRNSRK